MREIFGGGGDGDGGGFSCRIMHRCHGCNRVADDAEVRREWLQPHFVAERGNTWLQTQLCSSCAKWHLRYWIKVVFRLRIGRLSNLLAPGYGACGKCRTNWHFAEIHSTYVPGAGGGMFALCEPCWEETPPAERVAYYRKVFDAWQPSEHRLYAWKELEAAILAGG